MSETPTGFAPISPQHAYVSGLMAGLLRRAGLDVQPWRDESNYTPYLTITDNGVTYWLYVVPPEDTP